jgi:hypothetical protein
MEVTTQAERQFREKVSTFRRPTWAAADRQLFDLRRREPDSRLPAQERLGSFWRKPTVGNPRRRGDLRSNSNAAILAKLAGNSQEFEARSGGGRGRAC